MSYFSDRRLGPPPRMTTEIPEAVRVGIIEIIRTRAGDGWFGLEYPDQCPDGRGVTGTDVTALSRALAAYRIYNPFGPFGERPSTVELLDLIEFSHEKIAEPSQTSCHGSFDHSHLRFDRAGGQVRFRNEINRIFERNGIAFELRDSGRVERIAPKGLREALSQTVFNTGDRVLDELLERSRTKFLSRDPPVRREPLETLWDAWERLKSLEPGKDKKESTARILDRASADQAFRKALEVEARSLTDIGNNFRIRHAEVGKTPITDDEEVDFFFHRMFALIRLLLRKSDRGG